MATWKSNKPDGQDPIGFSDDYLRANFRLLEQALSATHVFSGTTVTRGMHRPGLIPVVEVATESVLTGYTDVAGAICWPTDLDGFWNNDGSSWYSRSIVSSGTIAIWAQVVAPAGWTLVTTADDGLVMASSGAAGSAIADSTWTMSGVTIAHTHLTPTVIAHRHTTPTMDSKLGVTVPDRYAGADSWYYWTTCSAPGTGGVTGASTNAGSGTISSDGTWRPKSYKCILAMKD